MREEWKDEKEKIEYMEKTLHETLAVVLLNCTNEYELDEVYKRLTRTIEKGYEIRLEQIRPAKITS